MIETFARRLSISYFLDKQLLTFRGKKKKKSIFGQQNFNAINNLNCKAVPLKITKQYQTHHPIKILKSSYMYTFQYINNGNM